jgi:hypothetical protein
MIQPPSHKIQRQPSLHKAWFVYEKGWSKRPDQYATHRNPYAVQRVRVTQALERTRAMTLRAVAQPTPGDAARKFPGPPGFWQ